jgi:hypothetical protein
MDFAFNDRRISCDSHVEEERGVMACCLDANGCLDRVRINSGELLEVVLRSQPVDVELSVI